ARPRARGRPPTGAARGRAPHRSRRHPAPAALPRRAGPPAAGRAAGHRGLVPLQLRRLRRAMTTVVVDALSVRLGGGLTYTGNQLAALAQVRPDLDLRVLVAPGEGGRALAARLPDADLRIPVTGGTARRVLWEQLRLARAAPLA